ncbi:MAG: hypothetical protein M1819_004583 [Sarea resinae]|nr:MAG: hypothetical protein M1819_006813 [Sarea resinae]KAI9832039.1 MAG: hypothetical protein M1819_004583 [Sarea resinae]
MNADLVEKFGKMGVRPVQQIRAKQPSVPANQSIREYEWSSNDAGNATTWLSQREIPSSAEIMDRKDFTDPDEENEEEDGEVELSGNIVDAPWDSKEQYLNSHYELLREDAVAPLREAVAEFRKNPSMSESKDLCIYDNVHIVGVTFANQGPAVRIAFSLARAGKRIMWQHSKRLMSGSLVALSKASDMFRKDCKVAIVAARPLAGVEQNPPEIDIFHGAPEELEIDPQEEWIMIESRAGYFEAYRHTLVALQKMSTRLFPLSEHLVHLQKDVHAPSYVESNPFTDLSTAFNTTGNCTASFENVNILSEWPTSPPPELRLDDSQQAAMRRILTKKLAIVQGPPGTGKTHVSVIALKAILRNVQSDDPPVIITAQTNHALDQLLRHVAEFEPAFIRLGGQSLDQEVIKPKTLFEIRKSTNLPPLSGSLKAPSMRKLKALAQTMAILLNPLQASSEPLDAALLRKLGILSQDQVDSLERGASEWVHPTTEGQPSSPMAVWLGDELARFNLQYHEHYLGFEYEEIDLEFEQLRELEAEKGTAKDDEDIESLRGTYVPLQEQFSGRKHPGIPEASVRKALKFSDMWKIPEILRGPVYSHFQREAKKALLSVFRQEAKAYMKTVTDFKIGKWEFDSQLLSRAKVVGVTTTGFSKYRALLSSLKPRVVLIEEAAETLEAPVIATCVESLEHLILVGDHKQLRGSCAVQELEGPPFNLGVSLFERLVTNGVEFSTLSMQRRMKPEIRKSLNPIYEELQDHPDVLNRPNVAGMGEVSSYFFSHKWPETKDAQMSACNQSEAAMVVGLYNHLFLNGTKPVEITVLTFYNGQRKLILRRLREHPNLKGFYFKVVTVDSYQGEENEIVILSLVRSNSGGNIGFLDNDNRVCVALSRARLGFYVFGNADLLCQKSMLWWKVVNVMSKETNRIGFHLPIECLEHKKKMQIKDPQEWDFLSGGCDRKCRGTLPCGDACTLKCHSFPHELVNCTAQPCLLEASKNAWAPQVQQVRRSSPSQIKQSPPRQLRPSPTLDEKSHQSPRKKLTPPCSRRPSRSCSSPSPPKQPQRIPLATTHARNVTPSPTLKQPTPMFPSPSESDVSDAWNHFAKGGVVASDAYHQTRLGEDYAKGLQDKLDKEAMISLFGGDGASSPVEGQVNQQLTPVRTFSDAQGGMRGIWKEVYHPELLTHMPEPSLLD